LNGTRRGLIVSFDMRSKDHRSHQPITLQHRAAVVDMKLLRDNNYLIGSCMNNQCVLWDRRMCKVVNSFPNYVNQYGMNRIGLLNDRLLFSGGDANVRVWDVSSARLIRTFPNLCGAKITNVYPIDSMPTVVVAAAEEAETASRRWPTASYFGMFICCEQLPLQLFSYNEAAL